MSCSISETTWAGVEFPGGATVETCPPNDDKTFLGRPTAEGPVCATDPFEDFDEDDFDDDFDDDFEEEWDEELPGDADQFEADVEEKEDGLPEPEFEDED